MNIVGGHTISVYRGTADRFGDRDDELVGQIENCVFQWASSTTIGLSFRPNDGMKETSEVSAVFYIPRDAAIKIEDRDRIVFNGLTYRAVGPRAWDEDSPATGHDFGYYMVQVEASG